MVRKDQHSLTYRFPNIQTPLI